MTTSHFRKAAEKAIGKIPGVRSHRLFSDDFEEGYRFWTTTGIHFEGTLTITGNQRLDAMSRERVLAILRSQAAKISAARKEAA